MGGLQGFFKGAMLAYFIIGGIGMPFGKNYVDIGFGILFFLGVIGFPIIWTKYVSKMPTEYPKDEEQEQERS